jgi:ATP-binding cassette, subfamily B, bacterial
MRNWLRAGRLMLGIGWETGATVFLTFVALSFVSSISPLVFGFGLKALVDGIVKDRTPDLVIGAVISGISLLVVVGLPHLERWVTPRLRERSIMVLQRRLLTLNASAPGLEHFERHDFWNRLQLLKRNFGDLLMGMANVLVGLLIVLQLLITCLVLATLQPILLVLPLIGLPAAWLSHRAEVLKRVGEQQIVERRRSIEHLFTLAVSPQSAKEIRVYGLEQELIDRHRRLAGQIQARNEATQFRAFGLITVSMVIFGAAYLGAVAVVLHDATGGRLSPGDVALAVVVATSVITTTGRLSDLGAHLLRAVAVSEHYFWLSERVSGPGARPASGSARPAPEPEVPARISQGIDLIDVTFAYPDGDRPALREVNLRLEPGTVVAVVGENGAGKTTLVKLLSRMYTPTSGEIRLDGVDIQEFDIAAYRRRISAAFQDYVRFELLALEAVGVGDLPKLDDEPAVRGALGRAGGEFAENLSGGLRTQLGRAWPDGVDLSGGEWQKLALARAMMREHPLLLIFDEPTASLDPQTEHALFERIAAQTREGAEDGRITLLISHRFSTVRMADLVIVIDEGRIVEHGTHEQLQALGGLYAELCGLQARAYRR